MYHFNLVPRMGLAESSSLYPLVQIRKSEIHNVAMLNNYIYIKRDVRIP